MAYDDPFYEPEDDGGFFLIPEGLQPAEVQGVVFNMTGDAPNQTLKSMEFTWYLEQHKGSTQFPTVRNWYYPGSAFGKSLLTQALENLEVPHEIPDPSAISKKTKLPRKTFIKALKNEVTGEFIDTNIVKKKALILVYHAWQCPDCRISNRMSLTVCPGKKNLNCGHVRDNTEKIYANIDNQSVFSITSGATSVAPELAATPTVAVDPAPVVTPPAASPDVQATKDDAAQDAVNPLPGSAAPAAPKAEDDLPF